MHPRGGGACITQANFYNQIAEMRDYRQNYLKTEGSTSKSPAKHKYGESGAASTLQIQHEIR
jgi:hypothetical protein